MVEMKVDEKIVLQRRLEKIPFIEFSRIKSHTYKRNRQ